MAVGAYGPVSGLAWSGSWASDAAFRDTANAVGDLFEAAGYTRTAGESHYDRSSATAPTGTSGGAVREEWRDRNGIYLKFTWTNSTSVGTLLVTASDDPTFATSVVAGFCGSSSNVTPLRGYYNGSSVTLVAGNYFLVLAPSRVSSGAESDEAIFLVSNSTAASSEYTGVFVYNRSVLTTTGSNLGSCFLIPFGITQSPDTVNRITSKCYGAGPYLYYVREVVRFPTADIANGDEVTVAVASGTSFTYRAVGTSGYAVKVEA